MHNQMSSEIKLRPAYYEHCTPETIEQHVGRIKRAMKLGGVDVDDLSDSVVVRKLFDVINKHPTYSPLTKRSYIQSIKALECVDSSLLDEMNYEIYAKKVQYDRENTKFTTPLPLDVIREKILHTFPLGSMQRVLGLVHCEWPIRDDCAGMKMLPYDKIDDFFRDAKKGVFPPYNVVYIDHFHRANIVICVSKTVPKFHRPIRMTMSDEFTQSLMCYLRRSIPGHELFTTDVDVFGNAARLNWMVKDILQRAGVDAPDAGVNYMRRAHRHEAKKKNCFLTVEDTAKLSFHKLEKTFDYDVHKTF